MTTLAPEKVTVTISSSAGEDAPLTVDDAMRQILDFFLLMDAAGGDEASSVAWQLVEISINSPLRATAQAVAKFSGVEAAPIARREKAKLAASIDQIVHGDHVPDWMTGESLNRVISIFERNSRGIGRTQIQFGDAARTLEISRREATSGISVIEAEQTRRLSAARVLPWVEYGTIEGTVKATKTHYSNPAVVVRERTTGEDITCIASERAIEQGARHTWQETWSNRRVLVTGELHYGPNGRLEFVSSADFEIVDTTPITFAEIADPNFTGGLSPSEYLKRIWGDDG